MLQSSDKDNHYMAMQAIVNLGDPNTVHIDYEHEILFLWLQQTYRRLATQ